MASPDANQIDDCRDVPRQCNVPLAEVVWNQAFPENGNRQRRHLTPTVDWPAKAGIARWDSMQWQGRSSQRNWAYWPGCSRRFHPHSHHLHQDSAPAVTACKQEPLIYPNNLHLKRSYDQRLNFYTVIKTTFVPLTYFPNLPPLLWFHRLQWSLLCPAALVPLLSHNQRQSHWPSKLWPPPAMSVRVHPTACWGILWFTVFVACNLVFTWFVYHIFCFYLIIQATLEVQAKTFSKPVAKMNCNEVLYNSLHFCVCAIDRPIFITKKRTNSWLNLKHLLNNTYYVSHYFLYFIFNVIYSIQLQILINYILEISLYK